MQFNNLISKKFGHLTVIQLDAEKTSAHNRTYWRCRCDCGKERSLQPHQLTSGKVTSCGCKNKRTIQGAIISEHRRLYNIYSSMVARCHNPKAISYKYYGEKGIFVCAEWRNSFQSFCKWALANGYKDTLTIDRCDNAKGYSPTNCRWATMHEQQCHKTNNVMYTNNGKTYSMREWCEILNVPYRKIKDKRRYFIKKYKQPPTFEELFLG